MLGFGSLKAMNDTMRQNRELLKAGKKAAFEKSMTAAKVTDSLTLHDKKLSEKDRILLIQEIWEHNRQETRKKLTVLIISATGTLAWLLLTAVV